MDNEASSEDAEGTNGSPVVDAVMEPVQIHSMGPCYVSHCRASFFVYLFVNSFVVFEDVQRCLSAKELRVGSNVGQRKIALRVCV